MMYHTAEAIGPAAPRQPEGLATNSMMSADPNDPTGWQITTDGQVIQRIPEEEFRLLIRWGANLFTDYADLKRSLDHSDDVSNDQAFDLLIADLRTRGLTLETPTDPLTDQKFITLLTRNYDPGKPSIFPPEPEKALAA